MLCMEPVLAEVNRPLEQLKMYLKGGICIISVLLVPNVMVTKEIIGSNCPQTYEDIPEVAALSQCP